MTNTKKVRKFRSEGSSDLKEDDIALVLRPTFNKKGTSDWNGKVDLGVLVMPINKLHAKDHGLIKDTVHALATCFHLLNTDSEFADRISEEMDQFLPSNVSEPGFLDEGENVWNLNQWTKTLGNA